jgi:hypothetical protein
MARSEWLLNPGDKILRKDLHQQYGGRRQGGIGPSASTIVQRRQTEGTGAEEVRSRAD